MKVLLMKEIYYLEGDWLMSVAVEVGEELVIGTPQRLFEPPPLREPGGMVGLQFDTLDGQRFFFNEPRKARDLPITVRLGWSRQLRHPFPPVGAR